MEAAGAGLGLEVPGGDVVAALEVESGEEFGDVVFGAIEGDAEVLADFGVGESFGDEAGDFEVAVGEWWGAGG